MDEKDALKVVKWWVESQIKVKKAFRESLFNALEQLYFYTKVKDSNAAALYDNGPPTNIINDRLTAFWHKVLLFKMKCLLVLVMFQTPRILFRIKNTTFGLLN